MATKKDSSVAYGTTRHRLDIQGLRAVAVLAVVAFHAGLPLPGGFTGVDIFFVISGFVITQMILRSHSDGSFRFLSFYVRRAQRLLPALALMVTVVLFVSLLIESPFGQQQSTGLTAIGSVTLMANVVIVRTVGGYFDPGAEANPLLNTWSLSVEEQFYLLFPLLLVVTASLPLRRSWSLKQRAYGLLAVVGALSVASFLISYVWSSGIDPLGLTSQPGTWAFYLAPARAWEFGVGALIWVIVNSGKFDITPLVGRVLGAAGTTAIVIGFFAIGPMTQFPGVAALLPVFGTAAVIAAGQVSNPVSGALSRRSMVRVGNWSYSIYLWHWPFIVFAVAVWDVAWIAPGAALASAIPALLSYRFLENPIRRLKIPVNIGALWALSLSALVALLGLLLWMFGGKINPELARLNVDRLVPTASEEAGCFFPSFFDYAVDQNDELQSCWLTPRGANGWVLLAGDSHASHVSTGVVEAARELDLGVYSVTGGACPFQRAPVAFSDVENCDELNASVWEVVNSDDPPDLVVISQKGVPVSAADTLLTLSGLSIPVVWVRDVPRWAPVDQGVQHLPCKGGIATFNCDFSLTEVTTNQMETRFREDELQQEFEDVTFVDVRNSFCSGETCSPIVDGQLMYRDNEHLNGNGSSFIKPFFVAALDSNL